MDLSSPSRSEETTLVDSESDYDGSYDASIPSSPEPDDDLPDRPHAVINTFRATLPYRSPSPLTPLPSPPLKPYRSPSPLALLSSTSLDLSRPPSPLTPLPSATLAPPRSPSPLHLNHLPYSRTNPSQGPTINPFNTINRLTTQSRPGIHITFDPPRNGMRNMNVAEWRPVSFLDSLDPDGEPLSRCPPTPNPNPHPGYFLYRARSSPCPVHVGHYIINRLTAFYRIRRDMYRERLDRLRPLDLLSEEERRDLELLLPCNLCSFTGNLDLPM
ncbi:uncharacterized protein STEHIDRAFT_163417 [Stereum hirsutum FP-91666 SS1]|uniref:Uncharacterized protein n=1 Tax=Stereum hirsutum (strain FP-91666) TaxID=721885 RepID=R7RYH1_STEHR|nr:uncharacterized protein STEHIDRAFT_163417 [Stereum hirsutum FP-91666 SS1]EIM79863.1 hypothetical protein STEHIDRAFT_163417 [Stereum hirsutum FP-91666 SS1]